MRTTGILVATGLLVLISGSRNATAQTLTTLYNFCSIIDSDGDCLDGAYPNGLILGNDGDLYGTTSGGGNSISGTVNGSVTYSVSANTSTDILAGTISIAGEQFTVIQAGVK